MHNDGFLYQLWATSEIGSGQYFPVNGSWDKHGIVVKFLRKDKEGYLHLIRGTGKKKIQN